MLHVFSLLFCFLFSLFAVASEEAPQTFTLDGRLYSDSAATTPLADVVSLKVQILDPAQTCIVYEEVQSVNTTTTAGYYTIQIGQKVTPPAGKRSSGDSNNGLTTIFSNSVSSITGKLLSDGTTVCTYNPTAGDTRYVKFTMTPAGDNIARTTTSNLRLDSVPMALVAERAENLRGLTPSQLLQVNGTTASLTQANIENIFSTLNYPNLVSLLSTAPANYVLKNSNGSTNIPSVAGAPGSGLAVGQIWYDSTNNQLKYYDGAVKVVGSSTAGTLAATAGGTGQSSFAVGDLLYANTTTALARLPASTSGYVLTSNGAGVAPSWQAAAGGGGSLSSTTAATTTNSINNANFAQTWHWNSATTESPLTLTSNAITTGSLLSLTSSSTGINSTNGLLNVANSTATTTGTLARFQANSTVGSGMTILNSGNVGVGTASPSYSLTVADNTIGIGTGIVKFGPSNIVVMGPSNTVSFNNSLAMGRSNNTAGADTAAAVGILNNATGDLGVAVGVSNSTIGYGVAVGRSNTVSAASAIAIGLGVTNSTASSLMLGPNDAAKVTILSAGNVGVGTTTPVEKLEVNGALKLGTTAGSNAGTIRWDGTNFSGYNGTSWAHFVPTPPASGACGTTVTYSTAGTYSYTVPASFGTITIKLWGAGGSGGGLGAFNGTSGGNTSIASLGLVAGGGALGPSNASGTFGSGGVASGGTINTNGANGSAPGGGFSGTGGSANAGGAGGAGRNSSGTGPNGAAPGGGGAGGTNTGGPGYGGGGGAGAYVEKTFTSLDLVPGTTLSDVLVGVGGVAAATTYMGGNGGAGQVSITCSTVGTPVANDRSLLFINSGAHATDTNLVYTAAGNVGIGMTTPGQKLSVAGTIESTSGGVKFPDGSLQTTAAASVKRALVSLSTDQNSTGLGIAAWASANYDTGTFWAGGNPSRLTIPTGVVLVRICFNARIDAAATGTINTRVIKNGSLFAGAPANYFSKAYSGAWVSNGCSAPIPVITGDYFEFEFGFDAASLSTLVAEGRTWMSIEEIK